jgi:hypothetical protein
MGKPKARGEASEFDEVMEEVLSDHDDPAKDDIEAAADDSEPKPEPAEEVAAAPEPESEPEPAQSEPQEEGDEEKPATPLKAVPDWDALKRERDGLEREIRELRLKNRKLAAESVAPQAPNPAQYAPPSTAPDAQGGDLADMISYADGRAGIDTQKLNAYIDQRTAPDPVAQRAAADAETYRSFKADFMARNPALHAAAIDHAEQAYQYLTESVKVKAADLGVDVGTMGLDQFIDFARYTGSMDAVGQHFPHLADELPSLLAASALSSVGEMDRVLSRYAGRLGAALGGVSAPNGSANPRTPVPSDPPPLPQASQAPNLVGVGTVTPQPKKGAKSRLAELREIDVLDLTDSEATELEKLEDRFERT